MRRDRKHRNPIPYKQQKPPVSTTDGYAILEFTSRGFLDLRTFEFLLTQTNYQSLVDVLIQCKDTPYISN